MKLYYPLILQPKPKTRPRRYILRATNINDEGIVIEGKEISIFTQIHHF